MKKLIARIGACVMALPVLSVAFAQPANAQTLTTITGGAAGTLIQNPSIGSYDPSRPEATMLIIDPSDGDAAEIVLRRQQTVFLPVGADWRLMAGHPDARLEDGKTSLRLYWGFKPPVTGQKLQFGMPTDKEGGSACFILDKATYLARGGCGMIFVNGEWISGHQSAKALLVARNEILRIEVIVLALSLDELLQIFPVDRD